MKIFILMIGFILLLNASVNNRDKKTVTEQDKKYNFVCGNKKYCKHMSSCEEARFYLTKCGLKRLDRDKDGIPCESICN